MFRALLVLLICALALCACDSKEDKEAQRRLEEVWAGAKVARVCRDGTRIFKLHDGRYVTGGWGSYEVADIDTVCAP